MEENRDSAKENTVKKNRGSERKYRYWKIIEWKKYMDSEKK